MVGFLQKIFICTEIGCWLLALPHRRGLQGVHCLLMSLSSCHSAPAGVKLTSLSPQMDSLPLFASSVDLGWSSQTPTQAFCWVPAQETSL